jgi:hypothetical protein
MHITDGGKFYDVDGRKVPRVTSILSILAKPALIPWAAKCAVEEIMRVEKTESGRGDEIYLQGNGDFWLIEKEQLEMALGAALTAHKRESEAAKEIGSIVHTMIQDNLTGKAPQPPMVPEVAIAWESYKLWKRDYGPITVEAVEIEVANVKCEFPYAGKVDYIGKVSPPVTIKGGNRYPHYRVLADFKVQASIYPETAMQLAAYLKAIKTTGIYKPNRAACVRLNKVGDPGYQFKEYSPDAMALEFKKFQALCRYWYLNDNGKANKENGE